MTLTGRIQEDVPLAPFTTLGVGGPAAYFFRAETEADVIDGVSYAAERGMPLFVLGGGSNILVADAGFDGLVLHIALKGSSARPERDRVCLTAAAGEDWDELVAHCVQNDLAGFECLSGIPGYVGGTPVQNVGAYGQEVSETIVAVRAFDRVEKTTVELTNSDCGFSYRKSIFNTTDRDRYVVLSVSYELRPGGAPKVEYSDLRKALAESEPDLHSVRETVLRIRRSKSMVIDPADLNSRSAGSFFKNPIVSTDRAADVAAAAGVKDEAMPTFPAGESVKIPAAWLIERAGFSKGYHLGNAGISKNHSLALINRGGATARELVVLRDQIQEAVRVRFGIDLVPEPVMVGF